MIELHREIRGSGPPLVILHGLFGSLANWRSVARVLSERFTVCSVDLRNHGRSPHHPVHTYSAMTCDVAGVLEEIGVARARLLGHSMGGKVAMNFALIYPERVERLAIVDIAPIRYSAVGELRDVLDSLRRIDPRRLTSREDADSVLRGRIEDPALRSFLLMNLRRDGEGNGFRWQPNLEALDENWESLGADVTATTPWRGPALFVRGALSNYVSPQCEPRIFQLFPAAQIVSIEQAGHWVHTEQPSAFLDVMLRFFTD